MQFMIRATPLLTAVAKSETPNPHPTYSNGLDKRSLLTYYNACQYPAEQYPIAFVP